MGGHTHWKHYVTKPWYMHCRDQRFEHLKRWRCWRFVVTKGVGEVFVNFFLTSLDRTWEDCTVWVERGVPNESKADILFHNWRNETEFKFKALIYLFSWFDTSIRNISYTVKGSLAAKLARYGCSKLETVTTVAKVVVERWAVASSSN